MAGGLLLAPSALAVEGVPNGLDVEAVAGYSYLGIVGAGLAYVLWFHGIGRLPATSVSFLGLFSPLVAVLVGVVLASEQFGVPEVIGTALVLSAVLSASGRRQGGPLKPHAR